jgi:asparagine synthase (glutamine-hydrolysing)
MNPILTDRLRLRERWEHVHSFEAPAIHALRPEAHRRLSTAPWAWYFETSDPGVTRIPVEIRYPFLDLRLVNYLLSIPPIPWCIDKEILRVAMHGALPDAVRLRPKAPLGGDPLEAGLRASHGVPLLSGMPEVAAYVNPDAAPIPMGGYKGDDPWLDVRPLCLSYWLAHARADMSRWGDPVTIKPVNGKSEGNEKKPYERPRLDVYGDVREIAKSIGKIGMADGATHGNTKTQ